MVEKQSKFTKTVAKFIEKATEIGISFTFAEAYRTPEQAALNAKNGRGISNSLHTQRLAIDLNAFKEGEYLSGAARWHIDLLAELGAIWKSLDPQAAWGGDFTKKDYNHYSFEHNGVK